MNVVNLVPFALGDPQSPSVIRRGKIFQCGDYPDKQFAVTTDQLRAAADAFRPVHNDLEHVPTVLDQKLGMLTSVSLSEDGEELFGEVEIPRWLHDALGDAPVKSSLSWDRETMQIIGNALVLEPRVSDAALMSAYAAFTGSATPAAAPEDALVGVFATIRALVTGHDPRPSVTPMSDTANQTVVTPARAQEVPVTEPAVTNLHAVAAISFADSPEFKAMQAQIDALKATAAADATRAASREAEFTRERAGTWADGEIATFRALPAERDALVAAFVDAATDDSTNPRTVSFSVNGESKDGSRVDALRARHSARAPHTLTAEQVANGTVLLAQRPANTATAKMSAERKNELLIASGFSVNS